MLCQNQCVGICIRNQLLITGRGGGFNTVGGGVSLTTTKREEGKRFSHAEGGGGRLGTTSFEVV